MMDLRHQDIQQPGPLIDHLLKMLQGQSLPGPLVYENMPILPIFHIMHEHLAGVAGQLNGLGRTGMIRHSRNWLRCSCRFFPYPFFNLTDRALRKNISGICRI